MASLNNYDVLVLGAGAAGLTAAKTLGDAGLNVCVVEARDRVGGRIWTVNDPGSDIPVELGAEFLHGHAPDIFDNIRSFGLPFYEVNGDYWCAYDDELRTCDFWEKIEAVLEKMKADGRDTSFLEFINSHALDPQTRRQVLTYIEGFEAADPERISVHSLARERAASKRIEGDRAFRLTAGYDTLINAITRDLKATIELNSPVKCVRWSKKGVEFDCEGRRMVGRTGIITLPLGVLQAGSVQFDPTIENKAHALSSLAMGSVMRISIGFRERFWENLHGAGGKSLGDMSFVFSDDEVFPTWWSTMPVRSSLLVGWSAGPHANPLSFHDKTFVFEQAIASLANKLHVGTNVLKESAASFHLHDWQADPYSLGAYSYALAGGSDAFQELAQSIDDTLFFAGEATNSDGFNGTVHGAIASGKRASQEVLEAIKRQRAA